jgi:hypothetical protein
MVTSSLSILPHCSYILIQVETFALHLLLSITSVTPYQLWLLRQSKECSEIIPGIDYSPMGRPEQYLDFFLDTDESTEEGRLISSLRGFDREPTKKDRRDFAMKTKAWAYYDYDMLVD